MKREHRQKIDAISSPSQPYVSYPLLADAADIADCVDQFLELCGGSLIIDITSFPKRFFFPFVARALDRLDVKDLVITYSVPQRYHEGTLAEDHRPLDYLPLFAPEEYPEPKLDLAVIGIGYLPLGIHEFFQPENHDLRIKLLFPFPPGPPHFQRNWKFLADFEKDLPQDAMPPIRVEAYNVSDTFDHIVELTRHGRSRTAFAPYGPKPMSLAMCLYARRTASPVVYTQPSLYHPEYSVGITKCGDLPSCHAYCIRIGGRDLYTLPQVVEPGAEVTSSEVVDH